MSYRYQKHPYCQNVSESFEEEISIWTPKIRSKCTYPKCPNSNNPEY